MIPYTVTRTKAVQERLGKVSADEVKKSLEKDRLSSGDFLNLISTPASKFLPQMRRRAAIFRKMHFGRTVRIYAPLYVSSYCINNCLYCGFRTANKSDTRKRLTIEQIIKEACAIRKLGIDSVLLVSGEDPKYVSISFLEEALRQLKKSFSYVSLEIYPTDVGGYRRLFKAGAHGLTIYQETYDRDLYKELHPSGPKRDYDNRIGAPARAAEAGFYNIGLGALLGLSDWRMEAVALASHASYLKKKYWRSKIQFSFPRITPIAGDFSIPAPVTENDLEQMMLAFRLCFPECDLVLSTRENCEFRNKAVQTCANMISAGSSVVPGGYATAREGKLGQFTRRDARTVKEVERDLGKLGLEAVFKDWDRCMGAE